MNRISFRFYFLPAFTFVALLFLSPGKSTDTPSLTSEQIDILNLIEFREEAYENYEAYRARLDQKLPLTGKQLRDLHSTLTEQKPLLDRLISYVNSNNEILKSNPEKLNRSDRMKYLTVLGMSLALADTYIQSISHYHNDKHLRRVLNEGGATYGKPKNFLRKCIKTLLKRKHVKRYARGTAQYMLDHSAFSIFSSEMGVANFWKSIISNSYLISLVSESLTEDEEKAAELENEEDFDEFSKDEDYDDLEAETYVESPSQKIRRKVMEALRYKKTGLKDFLFKTKMGIFGELSKFFGNSVGLVQFRKGKLYHDKTFISETESILKPMDIIQERTPFRLTDFFIPGYFGHAAIWIGNEQELKDLGLWEHPLIVALHDKIRSGASIIEALRPGTQANTVKHFSDIDDFAILRLKKPLEGEELKRAILATAQQYQKKYDFNFDVMTQRKLVCSEMMYIAFTGIDWRTEKSLGRFTINPDAVAERGTPGGEFDVVSLYVAGVKLTGDLSKKMKFILDNAKKKDSWLLKHLQD